MVFGTRFRRTLYFRFISVIVSVECGSEIETEEDDGDSMNMSVGPLSRRSVIVVDQ